MGGMINNSACIMVRANTMDHPEDDFRKCLESLKPIVDEYVVVNTRLETDPPDSLNEIAKEFGAKVYNHPWANDFSFHRNQTLKYANGKWCFCIDADEAVYFNAPSDEVRAYFRTLPENVAGVRILVQDIQKEKVVMEFPTVKIFRRTKVDYDRKIHNKPNIHGDVQDYGNIFIKHFGYDLSEEKLNAKRDRTIKLLHEMLAENPKDFQSYFYLNQQYSLLGDHVTCIEWADKYIKHREEMGNQFNPTIYFTTMRSLMCTNQMKKAGVYMEQALHDFPNDLDINLMMVEYGNTVGNYRLVEEGANRYLRNFQAMNAGVNGRISRPGKFIFTNNPESCGYVTVSLALGRYKESMFYMNNLHKMMGLVSDSFKRTFIENIKTAIPSGVPGIKVTLDEEVFTTPGLAKEAA